MQSRILSWDGARRVGERAIQGFSGHRFWSGLRLINRGFEALVITCLSDDRYEDHGNGIDCTD